MSVIAVHYNTYMTWKERSQFFEQIRQRIAAMPEVVSAGISTNATPPDNGWNTKFLYCRGACDDRPSDHGAPVLAQKETPSDNR